MTKQLIKYLFHIGLILLSIKFILFYIKGYKCYITKCNDIAIINLFLVISVVIGMILFVIGWVVIILYLSGDYDSFIKEKIDPTLEKIDPTLEKIVNFFNRRNL